MLGRDCKDLPSPLVPWRLPCLAAERGRHLSWSFCSPVCRDRKSPPEPVCPVLPAAAAAAKYPRLENERGKGNVVFKEILDSLIKLLF